MGLRQTSLRTCRSEQILRGSHTLLLRGQTSDLWILGLKIRWQITQKSWGGGDRNRPGPRLHGSSPTSTREPTNSRTASGASWDGAGPLKNNTDTEDNTGLSLQGLDVYNREHWGGVGEFSHLLPSQIHFCTRGAHLCKLILTFSWPTGPLLTLQGEERGSGATARTSRGSDPPPGSCDSYHSNFTREIENEICPKLKNQDRECQV